jgi:hypothetical protein
VSAPKYPPRQWCEHHGKWAYYTKRGAEDAIKHWHKHEHKRVYPCGDLYHIGSLPLAVLKGRMTQDEWWQLKGRFQEPNRAKRLIYQQKNPVKDDSQVSG